MRIATRSFKTFVPVALIVMAIVLTAVSVSEAGGRHGRHHNGFFGPRVFIGVGVAPAVVYPWWYHRPVYYYPAPVIVEEPPVYVQRQPAPAPPATAESYWYYCASAQGYYPTVQSCPEAWIKVPPRSQ